MTNSSGKSLHLLTSAERKASPANMKAAWPKNVYGCIKYIKRPPNALWFMDAILLHSAHQHVSGTHVVIFRVVRIWIQIYRKNKITVYVKHN